MAPANKDTQLEEVKVKNEELITQLTECKKELTKSESKVVVLETNISTKDNVITELTQKVEDKETTIAELQAKLAELTKDQTPYDGPVCRQCGSPKVEKRPSGFIQCLDERCKFLDREASTDEEE